MVSLQFTRAISTSLQGASNIRFINFICSIGVLHRIQKYLTSTTTTSLIKQADPERNLQPYTGRRQSLPCMAEESANSDHGGASQEEEETQQEE